MELSIVMMRIRDLDKINLVKLACGGFGFGLEPIFVTVPVVSIKILAPKVIQID